MNEPRMRPPDRVQTAVDAAFRAEWGRVLAALIRRIGDWDLAEECASEAFAQALVAWPREGIPQRPGAWLTTVAGNRALDRLRRARRGGELLEAIGRDPLATRAAAEDHDLEAVLAPELALEDDRLALIFTCCHPALALDARVALTLRTLVGLTTSEIARAFLVPEATMAKRLTRAKAKIARAGIPYRVPPADRLAERTSGVLAVIFLTFNEGYAATAGDELIRIRLCEEAIALGAAVHELMPEDAEVTGLQALMLLAHARRRARVDAAGDLVPLEEQDRGAWVATEIEQALELLAVARRTGAVGPYQLQAAIAACHVEASDVASTDWSRIVALYGELLAVTPSPVIALNRAVAVAMAGDLDRALAIVDELIAGGELDRFHLLFATRADLLRRRGEPEPARAAYTRALELAASEPERRFLRRRLDELT